MKEKKLLTRVETQVMNILWSLSGEGVTSAEMMDHYPEPKPAMTTLLTFLKRLTEKGFVRTDKQGKLLRFTSLISRDEYTEQYLNDTKDTLFGGSPASLVSFFVRRQQFSEDEVNELLKIIHNKQPLNSK
jgi:predicted transcriptional regulator